jgi:deoxyribonuclease-4
VPVLGAHLSIAGGLPRAVERAVASGCEALQIFTKSVGQWRARPLPAAEIAAFREAVVSSRLRACVAHASYLINPASPDAGLRAQSIAALSEELTRAEWLGLAGLVLHPGAAADEDAPARVADAVTSALRASHGRTRLLLEHTAGQGTCLGHRFEEIAAIRAQVPPGLRRRVGVCLDTCHLLAAGYPIHTAAGFRRTLQAFDDIVGLSALAVVHLNDSKRPCGSRVDRHTHIGEGFIGEAGFARFVNDPRLAQIPMILETPKTEGRTLLADPLDLANLARLRSLVR